MKMVSVILLFLVFLNAACQQIRSPEFDYLGQTPPGSFPEIFAPGIISSEAREHSSLTFSPDGTEIYFTRQTDGLNNILFLERRGENGPSHVPPPSTVIIWTPAPPFLRMAKSSPDGKYLFILDKGDIYWVDAEVIYDLQP